MSDEAITEALRRFTDGPFSVEILDDGEHATVEVPGCDELSARGMAMLSSLLRRQVGYSVSVSLRTAYVDAIRNVRIYRASWTSADAPDLDHVHEVLRRVVPECDVGWAAPFTPADMDAHTLRSAVRVLRRESKRPRSIVLAALCKVLLDLATKIEARRG